MVKFDHLATPVLITPFAFVYYDDDGKPAEKKQTNVNNSTAAFIEAAMKNGEKREWKGIMKQLPMGVAFAISIHKSQGKQHYIDAPR